MSSRVRVAVTVGISLAGLGVASDVGWAAKVQPVPLVKRNVTGSLSRIVGADARRADLAFARQLQSATSAGNFCRALDLVNRIDRVGAAATELNRIESALVRSGRTRNCVDRPALRTLRGGQTPGVGIAPLGPITGPTSHEQGEERQIPHLPIRLSTRRFNSGVQRQVFEPSTSSAFAAGVNDPIKLIAPVALADPHTGLTPPDPSMAVAGNVVLITGNTYLAVSTDGGRTFTYQDPAKIFTDSPDGGICCDQVLQFDPGTQRFYWLVQYWCTVQKDCRKAGAENRYRIAVASISDVVASAGTRWKYWNIRSRDVGLAGNWIDFPDLAVGRNFLYLTFNSPSKSAAVWLRIRKTDLRDVSGFSSIGFRYLLKSGDYVLKPVQNTGTRGYVVRRAGTSAMELKYWDDTSNTVHTARVALKDVPTQDCSMTTPDGRDFLGSAAEFGCAGFSSRVSGAAMDSAGRIWIGWTAGRRLEGTKDSAGNDRNDGRKLFPNPHVELAEVQPIRVFALEFFALISQQAIYNNAYAYAYPYLTSAAGEVGMSYLAGGGSQYMGFGVGLLSNTRSLRRVINGTVGTTRVGDYLAARPGGSLGTFAGAGYFISSVERPAFTYFGRGP